MNHIASFPKLATLLALFLSTAAFSQKQFYKKLDIKEGLNSSIVYFALQDRKGFVWFGTSQGLSRYNGVSFKNYTTQDGLTDNEVFRLAEDSMERLWAVCYNSGICFIRNGKVYNAGNDSTLKKISAGTGFFRDIWVDKKGRVWIYGSKVYLIEGEEVYECQSLNNEHVLGLGYFNDKITAVTKNAVYDLDHDRGFFSATPILPLSGRAYEVLFFNNSCYLTETHTDRNRSVRISASQNDTLDINSWGLKETVSGFTVYNAPDSTVYFSSVDKGIVAVSPDFKSIRGAYTFLPKSTPYTFLIRDRDANLWVTSLGSGVFFIPAENIQTYAPDMAWLHNITSLLRYNHSLFVGLDDFRYGVLQKGRIRSYPLQNKSDQAIFTEKRVVAIGRANAQDVILGTDYGLYKVNTNAPGVPAYLGFACVKSMAYEGIDSVLLGTNRHALRLKLINGKHYYDTLWNSRTTAIAKDRTGNILLGSLSGLFVRTKKGVEQLTTNTIVDESRVADLLVDEYENVWVATAQRGAYVIARDSTFSLNIRIGLNEMQCVRFFKDSANSIWMATNRAIYQIRYKQNPAFTCQITNAKHFNDMAVTINDFFVDSGFIWAATSNGLLRIKVTQGPIAPPPVYVTAFKVGDSLVTGLGDPVLKYSQNNIQISFVGIAFNSGGQISYKYLLDKGDTVFTSSTSVDFNSLPPGTYILRVWAINASGTQSLEPAVISFRILAPFWRTYWFAAIVFCITSLMVFFLFKWRVRNIQKRANEKNALTRKISQAELQAVKAQMNEHFIFNSLSSIQSFINLNDIKAANFYLSNFGKLIRRTLDISAMAEISLEEEMDFLETYLILEKMRFGDKFDYRIEHNIKGIPAADLLFPSMILQPYVENAVKHGLLNKVETKGYLIVRFEINGDFIVCTIDDNGVGRAMAGRLRHEYAGHTPKGMNLSEERVSLFNLANRGRIEVHIEDKSDDGAAAGTLVKIRVPLKKDT